MGEVKIPLGQFLELPTGEVAELIRQNGSIVCVFPFNGTRRWFMLKYGDSVKKDFIKHYIEATTKGYIDTYKLVFSHGVNTILAPVFGREILSRGEEYMREIGAAMSLLATHPAFVEFYKEYDIRVHFYGDYRKQLEGTPYAYICGLFDDITKQTSHHGTRRLFYGVFADNATQSIAELSIQYFKDNGKIPTRRELVETYYGEHIEKADIFIGFEKFNVFDYPMLESGEESLYFTVAPSLFLNERQLRKILYDHMYLRLIEELDYLSMDENDRNYMRQYYESNLEETFGVGIIKGGIWYENTDIKGKTAS